MYQVRALGITGRCARERLLHYGVCWTAVVSLFGRSHLILPTMTQQCRLRASLPFRRVVLGRLDFSRLVYCYKAVTYLICCVVLSPHHSRICYISSSHRPPPAGGGGREALEEEEGGRLRGRRRQEGVHARLRCDTNPFGTLEAALVRFCLHALMRRTTYMNGWKYLQ